MTVTSEQVEKIIRNVTLSFGVELFRIEKKQCNRDAVIKVYIHKLEGVTIKDCADVNRSIDTVIEAEGLQDQNYTLEVSSLGIDHPLKDKREFEINVGRSMTVYYQDENQKKNKQTAKLVCMVNDVLHFKNEENCFILNLNQILKGVVEVSF